MYVDKNITIITGSTGSGKTEFAVQYALQMASEHDNVNLVDLDVINIYYRSRENKKFLEDHGIKVWGAVDFDYNGIDLPNLSYGFQGILKDSNKYGVLDMAGGQDGLKVLMAMTEKDFFYDMWMVCNIYREDTDSSDKIISMINNFQKFSSFKITGIVNNTNLLYDTQIEDIIYGDKILKNVSKVINIPIIYTVIPYWLKDKSNKIDCKNMLYIENFLNSQNIIKEAKNEQR